MDELKLQYFLSVARHKSFSMAAQELHVVQSTVSRQIAALEQELGSRLFIRDTHGVHLTKAGARLWYNAPSYMRQFQNINDNVKNLLVQDEHRLQINMGPYELPLVIRAVQQYKTVDPDLEMYPGLNMYNRQIAQIRSGTSGLLFAIRQCAAMLPNCLHTSLGYYQWKAVAHRDSSFWKMSPQDQAVLKGHRVVIAPSGELDPVLIWLHSNHMQHQGRSVAGAYYLAIAQASIGGVAIIPEYWEPWLPPELRMAQVFPDPLEVESVLLYNPASSDSQDQTFFEYIRDHYKP